MPAAEPAAETPAELQPAAAAEAMHESAEDMALLSGTAIPGSCSLVAAAADHHPVEIPFDDRDEQLLRQLQKSAYDNRRTLAAEILFRLDRTFDSAA